MEQILFQVLRSKEPEDQAFEVLIHEPMQRTHIVAAKDLCEGVRVPALKQLSFLLEDKVIELWVGRHHQRPPNQAGPKYWPISKMH